MKTIKENVEDTQSKQKENFDIRNCVKRIEIQKGDWVRIKCATHVPKGKSKFSKPVRVENVYVSAVRVQSGHWWNCARLTKVTGEPSTNERCIDV